MIKEDPLGNIDNYVVLAACILAPNYLCPEKAFAMYANDVPFTNNGAGVRWIDDNLLIEIYEMSKKYHHKPVCEWYGLSYSSYRKQVRKAQDLIWTKKYGVVTYD